MRERLKAFQEEIAELAREASRAVREGRAGDAAVHDAKRKSKELEMHGFVLDNEASGVFTDRELDQAREALGRQT